MAQDAPNREEWEKFYYGLEAYLMCMIGEYGHLQTDAEADLMAEINNISELVKEDK